MSQVSREFLIDVILIVLLIGLPSNVSTRAALPYIVYNIIYCSLTEEGFLKEPNYLCIPD